MSPEACIPADAEALISPIVEAERLIAVVTVAGPDQAVPLARALAAGGVRTVEITLRTPRAVEAVRAAAVEAPEAVVGAGTCLSVADLHAARDAGAAFAVSPGTDARLLEAAREIGLPYLPGAATASDVMTALAHGYRTLKFFPAVPAGGAAYLKALGGPFPQVRFCPTGGVDLAGAAALLALGNVVCVGGSWVAPDEAVRAGDWARIERLARAASAALAPSTSSTA